MNKIIKLFFLSLIFISCSVHKEYYFNGNLKEKGNISDNRKSGKWKTYYESGELKGVGNFHKGEENGEWKYYYKNGQIRQIGKFKDGKQDGKWIFFHPNGNRQGIGVLVKGKRIGKWQWYHENGNPFTERLWENGSLKEIIFSYDGSGNELDKGTLKNGNGSMKLYDIDGKLLDVINYRNGHIVKK
ncbi:toxin-antitoxin system YwqK family antitoxin [Salegentibacter maritimus]|uniref:toxin-antitoxin system YwqK family antitoxin n=1 Tax=Salegentibacter maritimus TaxID=2794347 RepID=UPI0018E4434B|nr:toxin-antitoxin system YwqK family antitoxin [Salegentibacter maritimus]MBI6117690.1 toxin-antitoxin system YwqK family antitoxin [Salegentibacter maritimus]